MKVSPVLSAAALLGLPILAQAQSLVSGFMNGDGKGAVAVSYTAEQFDEAFLVPSDADEVPVFNKINVNSVSLFATYGISARLDFVLNLPYITAKATPPKTRSTNSATRTSGAACKTFPSI